MEQQTIFDMLYPKYKIDKPIRLIELFAGYGSQALALNYLGVEYEHWKICEWSIKSIQAYKDIHFTDDKTDYSKDLSKEEVYIGLLEDYSKCLMIPVEKGKKLNGFFKYYKYIATTNINGKEADYYKVFKGSSEFDTEEMSVFLDGIIQECKQLGIETLTPEQIALMELV